MTHCKTKSITSRVILAIAFLVFSFAPMRSADACIGWGEGWCTTTFQITAEKIIKTIEDIIVGVLQQAGAEMINTTVSGMISSGSTQASLFISNWNDELFMGPNKKTGVFMNDFFTFSAKGRISTKNYQSCGSSGGLGGDLGQENYFKYLTDKAKFRMNLALEIPEITLPGTICNPFDLFGKGGWGAFHAFSSDPANNPTGYSLLAQNAAASYQEQALKESETKAIANQGYKAQEKNGIVVTPGSTVKGMQDQALDVGNQIMANANSIPQVVSSLAVRITTKSIRQGIGNAQKNAQREINKKTQLQQQSAQQQLGPSSNSPGAQFRR